MCSTPGSHCPRWKPPHSTELPGETPGVNLRFPLICALGRPEAQVGGGCKCFTLSVRDKCPFGCGPGSKYCPGIVSPGSLVHVIDFPVCCKCSHDPQPGFGSIGGLLHCIIIDRKGRDVLCTNRERSDSSYQIPGPSRLIGDLSVPGRGRFREVQRPGFPYRKNSAVILRGTGISYHSYFVLPRPP